MFTGLVEAVGTVKARTAHGDGERLTIAASGLLNDVTHGASIAVNGVCLTVVEFDTQQFSADVMQQTLQVSSLGALGAGSAVNLERAARLDSRLGGHIVQGHVDGMGTLLAVTPGSKWSVLRFSLPVDLAPLLVNKGSVTVDGVSLTVSAVSDPAADQHWFEVSLIPETLSATTLGQIAVGARVNIETDMIARHIARLAAFGLGANMPGVDTLDTQNGAAA